MNAAEQTPGPPQSLPALHLQPLPTCSLVLAHVVTATRYGIRCTRMHNADHQYDHIHDRFSLCVALPPQQLNQLSRAQVQPRLVPPPQHHVRGVGGVPVKRGVLPVGLLPLRHKYGTSCLVKGEAISVCCATRSHPRTCQLLLFQLSTAAHSTDASDPSHRSATPLCLAAPLSLNSATVSGVLCPHPARHSLHTCQPRYTLSRAGLATAAACQ